MESVLGGGVLLAVAAALWLVYLVPNWLRRSEYLATERNAVRLQQTIRVLAETAETPEAVRLENAAKARALEARLRQRPVAVGAPVLLEDPTDPRVLAAARVRRVRIATTVVIALAGIVLLSQLVAALVAGIAAASMAVVLVSGGFLGAGLWLQGRLARVQRARRRSVPERAARVEGLVPESSSATPAPQADSRAWTPQPLPQPLHQLRRAAALRAAAESERQAAAREAEERRVAAAAARALTESGEPEGGLEPVAVRPPSRFASMGVIDAAAAPALDLDGALARRRAS